MVSRCLFITSSYSSRCLRASKFRPSTDFCAAAIRFETIFDSIATPFSMPSRFSLQTYLRLNPPFFSHAEPLHQCFALVARKDAHQIVFGRQEESRRAG